MHGIAFHPHEWIVVGARLEIRLHRHTFAQRKNPARPCPMPQPLARVGTALCMQAEQIVGRALHARGGREQVRDAIVVRMLRR